MTKKFKVVYGSFDFPSIYLSEKTQTFNGLIYNVYNLLNGHKLYIKNHYKVPETLQLLGHMIINEEEIIGKNYYFKL